MNIFTKNDIGKKFKQVSGYIITIIGSFILDNNEEIFVTKSNRPESLFSLYFNNGNSYWGEHSNKDYDSSNYSIRKEDEITYNI